MNCRYKNGKFYFAFVRKVNEDGTYGVYFPEDSEPLDNVPAAHIKSPITRGKTTNQLSKYKGMVFFDKGSTGEDPKVPYFEAGEFVVSAIGENNNFICLRVGEEGDSEEIFDIGYVIARIREYEEE